MPNIKSAAKRDEKSKQLRAKNRADKTALKTVIKKFDAEIKKSIEEGKSEKDRMNLRMAANKEIAIMLQKETDDTLNHVLYEASNVMRNQYSRSDH